MNSFKELENDQIKLFAEARHKRVYDRVYGSLGSLRFLSTIIEMYVPVMADTVVSLTGGPAISTQNTEANTEELNVREDIYKTHSKPPNGPSLLDDDNVDEDIPRIS